MKLTDLRNLRDIGRSWKAAPEKVHRALQIVSIGASRQQIAAVRTCPGEPEERQVLVVGPDDLGVCTWQDGGVYESDVPNLTISSREAAKAKAEPKRKKKKKVMKVKAGKKAKAKPVAKAADDSDDDDSDGEEAEEEGEDQDEKEKGGAAEGVAVEADAAAAEPVGIAGVPAEVEAAAEKPKQA